MTITDHYKPIHFITFQLIMRFFRSLFLGLFILGLYPVIANAADPSTEEPIHAISGLTEIAEGCYFRAMGTNGGYQFCDLIPVRNGINQIFRIYWRQTDKSITYEFYSCGNEYSRYNQNSTRSDETVLERKCSVRMTDMNQNVSLGSVLFVDYGEPRGSRINSGGVHIFITGDNGDIINIFPSARKR